MAVDIAATREITLTPGGDVDTDGVIDPGDTVTGKISITNNGTVNPADNATAVTVTDDLAGLTLVPGSVQVTPIAFDDAMPSIVGNTPITFTAAQLLGNDVDPDGAEINLTITGVSGAANGAIVNNGDGTYTFTPTTGYVGDASFQYTIGDEQGRASVSTGVVSFTVTDPVWYVNSTYTGVNGASDGSYAKPFTSLAPLSTGGGADALDNADDSIFVYNAGSYSTGIVLEAGQKLFGDGHAFSANGLSIGANLGNTTISHSGVGVTLLTNNTIMGVTLTGTANGAIGVEDGGVNVGTFTMDESSINGLGKAVDIDNGGSLAVDLDQMSSASSTTEGVHLQGTTGTFAAATGIIQTSTGTGVLLGASGGGTASSGGDVNFTFGGDISSPGGSLVEIQDRTGGTIDFNGILTEGSIAAGTTGILIDGSAGTINFDGQTFVSAGGLGGNGVTLTNNSGTINFNATGTGLDITTATGSGLTFTGGGTLNVTGAANSIVTGTGQTLNLQNGAMGTSGIAFQTLTSGTVAAGNAININNLDAAGAGTFSGGAVTIGGTGGAGADGINITGSNSTFNFASTTIDNTAGDGIEINGVAQTQGAVTFTTVNLDGMAGAGISIAGATNAVSINGGTIGATNDPAGDGVNVSNGTGAVTVAASVTQSSGGNNVVDVSGHSGGAITFSGAITAAVGGGGIRLVNNIGGNIDFTGNTTLNTGSLSGITFTNTAGTGANVTFSEGTLDLDTTSGTGINATSTTVGAGSLTISGGDNFVNATTGRAINIDGVTTNITLEQIGVSGGGTTTGVFLQNTGAGGQFIVTGTGSTAGSGGTITSIGGGDLGSITAQATTGTGMYLNNVSNVSLSNMNFTGAFTNFGIRGDNVNNFTLRDSAFTGTFGNNFNFDEAAIRFGSQNVTTGLTGTALFEGNVIGGGIEDNVAVYTYGSNNLNIAVRDSVNDQAVFNNNDTTNGNDGFYLESGGTSNVTVTVDGVAFNGARGDLLQVLSTGSTQQDIIIQNNTFHNAHTNIISGGGGIAITGGGTNIDIDYLVNNNTFKGMRSSAIFSSFGGVSGNISGLVTNNTQGTANGVYDTLQANRGSMEGMFFFGGIDAKQTGSTGNVNYGLRIEGNTIRDVNGIAGILLRSNQQDAGGQARLEATITNNTMAEMGPNIAGGVYLQPGGASLNNDKGTLGLNMSNNNINFTIGGASASGDAVVFDQAGVPASFYMPGYTSAPSADPNTLANFLKTTKGNVFTNAQVSGTGGVLSNTGAVNNQAFVLTVPSALAPGFSKGWEYLSESPVADPPRDPETSAPDISVSDETTAAGDGTAGSLGTGDTSETGATGPTPAADDAVLTAAELASLVDAAIQRWIEAGATAEQIEAMRAVQFGVVDMAGIVVGTSELGVISIDSDGAGFGWFVDTTPGEDGEFNGSGTRLAANPGGAAEGRLDLLTVLIHELGHQIGLDDEYVTSEAADVMFGYMGVGERRLPADGETAGAVPGSIGSTAFALTPVAIGTLPAGKTVDVHFTATVDAPPAGVITNPLGTATVSGGNFANETGTSSIVLDSLTLGDRVFIDADKDGTFDAGEGINGVALTLFVDTNGNNTFDSGIDTQAATAITAGAGAAAGSYSFAGLAEGSYIVRVDADNFTVGPLVGLVPEIGIDPDDNVENDSNGSALTGGIVTSQAITLDYNEEPIPGSGNDTNTTLDFGFVAPNQEENITGLQGDTVNFTEGGAAVKLDQSLDAAITQVDSPDYAGGSLTVALSGGTPSEDQLGFDTNGVVTITAGNELRVGGTLVGTFAGGGAGGSDIVITLNSAATATTLDDVLRNLTYSNSNTANPSTATRTVTYTLVDGDGIAFGGDQTTVRTSSVTVTGTNDDPSISGFTGGTVAEFSPVGTVVGTASASDPDGLAGLVFSLDDNAGGRFAIDASTGEVTVANRGALDFESDSSHGIVIRVTDPETASATSNRTITLTDAPEIYLDGPGDGTFTVPTSENWTIYGEAGSDSLTAGTGSDYLDGGIGDDSLAGGTGRDSYLVDAAGDSVTELAGEGNDIVYAAVDYSLAAGVEVEALFTAWLDPNAAIDLTGNEIGQQLRGNAGVNVLDGGGGNDTLYGGAGADTLNGGSESDYLDGGIGDDSLAGGTGRDSYLVDAAGDTVTELSGEGNDIVYAAVDYSLAAGVEVEALFTAGLDPNATIDLTGNEFGQQLRGNAGVNVLNGGGGNDTLYGEAGADTLIGGSESDYLDGGIGEDSLAGGTGRDSYLVDAAGDSVTELAGEGNDIVYAAVDYSLAAGVEVEALFTAWLDPNAAIDLTGNELGQQLRGNAGVNVLDGGGGNDTLYGGAGADTLNGGSENDYLDGGIGDDSLAGGTGRDSYLVDAAGDTVTELSGEGNDIVYAAVDYSLAAGVEVEALFTAWLDPNASIDLTGNEFGQLLWGNVAANRLNGKDGNDTLRGEGGADSFVFTTALGASNIDTLVDFTSGTDEIELDDAIFGALATGALAANAFVLGNAAQDADDRIIYDQTTGNLFYDVDGNGAGGAVQFALIEDKSAVAASDFLIG